jgi:hypothetical protein
MGKVGVVGSGKQMTAYETNKIKLADNSSGYNELESKSHQYKRPKHV